MEENKSGKGCKWCWVTRANCENLTYEKKPEGMRFMKSVEKNLASQGIAKAKALEWALLWGSQNGRSREKVGEPEEQEAGTRSCGWEAIVFTLEHAGRF